KGFAKKDVFYSFHRNSHSVPHKIWSVFGVWRGLTSNVKRQASNVKRQTSNVKRQTSGVKRQASGTTR
ncbi:MAG: hypothetical protein D6796_10585, partial [Caldilineae bacterium]